MGKARRENLVVGIRLRAERMLLDFVNTMADDAGITRFKTKWERYRLKLEGTNQNIRDFQRIVRETWEGKHSGVEAVQLEASLGLMGSDFEEDLPLPPIRVDWKHSRLYIDPHNLDDLIWLTLLQNSQRLGVCENHTKGGECPTPYFLKYRPTARFCSEACAVTAQRESKRRWWKEHGREWLEKRRAKKS